MIYTPCHYISECNVKHVFQSILTYDQRRMKTENFTQVRKGIVKVVVGLARVKCTSELSPDVAKVWTWTVSYQLCVFFPLPLKIIDSRLVI